jgi:hypothetical protein
MWGATLLLMGFILQAVTQAALWPLLTVLSVLGIALTVCVWVFALQFNRVKRHKYARCKEIEKALGLQQHRTLRWKARNQRVLYGLVMVILLVNQGSSKAWAQERRPIGGSEA